MMPMGTWFIANLIQAQNAGEIDLDVYKRQEEAYGYDKLVLTVGASPAKLPIEGTDLSGVFQMRTPDDAENIRSYVEENQVKKAVVIGAGFIGLEVAENLKAKGVQVTVIDFASQILPNIVDAEVAVYAKKHLLKEGIRVITGTKAVSYTHLRLL